MTTTLQVVESLKRKNEAKDARIQMLLRVLADKERELKDTRRLRDTYAEGLHALKREMFGAKMLAIVERAATTHQQQQQPQGATQ